MWTPETVSLLQHAVRGNARERYDTFAKLLNEQGARIADKYAASSNQDRGGGRTNVCTDRRS